MSILKLPNAGDSATLDITGCEIVEGQYGQQVAFTSGDDVLYLPRASADRQLERLFPSWDTTYEAFVGERLIFSRTASTKPGAKPFWNINLAEKKNGKPPVATSNVPNQQLPALLQNQEAEDAAELQSKIGPPEKPKLTKLYLEATEFFLEKVVPLFEAKEIGLSDTAVVAGIATLFIAASKER